MKQYILLLVLMVMGAGIHAYAEDGNHSIFRLDTHRNPAYLCAITNY